MAKGDQRYEKERVTFNLARMKMGGQNFEVVINPDEAIEYRNGNDIDIRDVLKSEKVFADASQGKAVSEHEMEKLFKTTDPIEVAKQIIKKGEIQLTSEYRAKLREEKKLRIVDIIHRNGVDPRTGFPHPPQRIEAALVEAKVRIDEYKRAEDQVQEILSKIRQVLPISFQTKKIQVLIPAQFAAKSYSLIKNFGAVQKDEWQNDGSLLTVIEMPAGIYQDFLEELNKLTHGNAETKEIK